MSGRGAIIGFGKIAESTHVGALTAAGLQVVAVVDSSPERREAAQHALPDAHIYSDVATLLAEQRLDFVDICTPPHLHFAEASAAISANVHVLCEKPLVLTPADGDALARLALAHNVVVACVHNWTHAPILRRARALAAGGSLGALRSMDLITLRTQPAAVAGDTHNWRVDPTKAGGGILFDHGWHGMSILLRTVGATPVWVRGKVENRRFHDLAVEDTSETVIEFDNGVVGRFEATWAASERANRATLRCAEGVIEVDNDTLRIIRDGEPALVEVFAESLAGGGYRPEWTAATVREFKHEIDNRSARGALLHEALTALRLLMATYASSVLAGLPVPFVEPIPVTTVKSARVA